VRAGHSTRIRVGLYAGVALSALIAAPSFAQEAIPTAADAKPMVLAQADQATSASARPASGNTVQEVVVTGIRRAEISAEKLKRSNEDIVDAISAEDIGKLPDASIADSIARLPGLAAQRDNSGRTQDISIDGLPSMMNTTLLNGFMQATTDNNRTTQFDQYPAEIMNSVVVYKTGDAALVGAAIGTVDMQTVKPLDYGKTNLFVGVQGEYATEGKLQPGASDTGYRANLTYITQLDNDKLGVMFGYSHIETPNQIIAQHPWGYYAADHELEGGMQDQLRSDTLTRDSGTLTLQYRPTNNLEFIAHAFSSTYDDDAIIRGVEFATNPGTLTSLSNGVSSWTGLAPQLESYDYREASRLRSTDLTMTYTFGDGWKLHGDYGYNDARNQFDELQLYSGFGLNGQQSTTTATLTDGRGPGGGIGISNWSENLQNVALGENLGWSNYIPAGFPGACPGGVVSPNNPPQWGSTCNGGPDPDQLGGAGQNLMQTTYDSIQQTKWSLSKELSGVISKIEVGAAYSIRKKEYSVIEDELYLLSGNESMAIPSNLLSKPTNMSIFGLPSMFSINPRQAFESGLYGSVEDYRARGGGNGASLSDWAISERVFTPYFKANIRTELAGRPLTGNFGVQAVDTSQRVLDSYETNNGGGTLFQHVEVPTTTNYWEVLPSLNLTWRLDDNQDLRFAAGRSLARARFDQLGGGSSVNFAVNNTCNTAGCPSPFSGSIANPALKPWISDDVEFTYEHYFAPGEGVSLEAFYKNLENYINPTSTIGNFQAWYNATGPYPGPAPFEYTGPVTEWVNGHGGALYGLILSGNYQLKHLSPWLDGFGFSGTAGLIESSVRIGAAPGCAVNNINTYQTPCQSGTPDGRLPQYSKYIGNVTFYYEKNGWSLRINDRYRSKYDQEVVDYNGGLQPVLGDAENIVDLQAGYDITTGPLKNLSFTFSAENLTNTAMNSYTGTWDAAAQKATPAMPKDSVYYKLFGTNIMFGVRYKY
jgi:iron complex outermembrane receptor protein